MTDTEHAQIATSETGARQALTPHGQAQRDALVDSAYHLIAEGGFEHLRTREVATRAGVNIATLHYYFATKEDLIRAVVDRVQHEFETIHAPDTENSGDAPLEKLRRELLDTRFHLRRMPQTYFVSFELALRALRDPVIHRHMAQMDHNWRAYLESVLDEGRRQGVFRADLDVPTTAAALAAFFKGACLQMMMSPETFDVDRVLAELDRGLLRDASRTPA